ncbi:type I-E CRISPR-associated protein Cse2/CasB [Brachybacterium sp. p3-SID957]|uniref:type I-E CRISPR-associated protein Cse2/CasB n=1 Tax=Brachybacterium sp. p3-SID957 TaxID=2916049 RepID=UPI00223BA192|nr:type I-E CRISPR-associated protein Cse2/CasB [Brachybacterium sp. p3-SID957]MCT1775637.1 type I-E CRISPR-associated protein Cse2/CasB [Brachybacterium sp. p3-SID957]
MAAETVLEPPPASRSALLSSVTTTVERLQRDALGLGTDRARQHARTTLSHLRRSVGNKPEQDPLVWQKVIDLLTPEMPEQLFGTGESPSPSEAAAFDALCLFALHLQGANAPAHRRGRSFGTAVGILAGTRESKSIRPRMDALLASRDHPSRMQHARSLITLLKGTAPIPLDYGLFALDLRKLAGPDPDGVLLRWGRDVVTGPAREKRRDDPQNSPTSDESTQN